jgi:hypothetical protein
MAWIVSVEDPQISQLIQAWDLGQGESAVLAWAYTRSGAEAIINDLAARLWAAWQEALAFVQPRTVLTWQRQWFRTYWRRFSQGAKPSRPVIAKELHDLIRKMSQANPTWGSPWIV